jgi:hypothetical protein
MESGRAACGRQGAVVSLAALASDTTPDRNVSPEYHDVGSSTGAFEVQRGHCQHVHYVACQGQ